MGDGLKKTKHHCRVNRIILGTTGAKAHSNSMTLMDSLTNLKLGFSQCYVKGAVIYVIVTWAKFLFQKDCTFFFLQKKRKVYFRVRTCHCFKILVH